MIALPCAAIGREPWRGLRLAAEAAVNPLFQPVKDMAAITDNVIVAVSGGKDSVVTLDLCSRHFKKVSAFFMYFVKNLSFQEKWLNWAEDHYGIEILRIPHFDLSDFVHNGAFRPEQPETPVIKINDVYAYVRQEFDAHWIAAGERIADSIWRRAMMKQSGLIDHKRGRFYPVGNFTKPQVFAYLKAHHLPVSEESRTLGFSFRSFMSKDLMAIKEKYPDDFIKIVDQFPFIEASIKQLEYFNEPVPEV